MRKGISFIGAIIICNSLAAQLPEDVIRMSWNTPRGSARVMAIGGAMGSLGGDITANFVNPAGLGFYKTGEFILSPGFKFGNIKSDFRGTNGIKGNNSAFDFGTTGFVTGNARRYGTWTSTAFSLAVNRTANFNNTSYYRGRNDFSSFSEAFAEEFALSGLPIDAVLYDAPLSLGSKLANYTYLIDTVSVNGNIEVVGLPQRDAILNGVNAELDQERRSETRGGITELAMGFAANMDDNIYLGIGIGIPIVNYERTTTLTETDASGITDNNFASASYTERQKTKGAGVNAKLGLIIKPVDQFRIGLAVHTPTLYALEETYRGSITADLENYFPLGSQVRRANEDSIYSQFGYEIPKDEFDLTSPWKFLVSASYVIREIEDVTKQRGFITADVEYVTHRSSRFSSEYNQNYVEGVNNAIKNIYKPALNFRLGGELKFNTIMTRLGFSYYGSPYEDKEFKARRMNVHGGLGYRNKGFFIDLTYMHSLNRDVNFPYRLADKANTFADLRESTGNLMMTFGVKF